MVQEVEFDIANGRTIEVLRAFVYLIRAICRPVTLKQAFDFYNVQFTNTGFTLDEFILRTRQWEATGIIHSYTYSLDGWLYRLGVPNQNGPLADRLQRLELEADIWLCENQLKDKKEKLLQLQLACPHADSEISSWGGRAFPEWQFCTVCGTILP